jgi:hypothetical protein
MRPASAGHAARLRRKPPFRESPRPDGSQNSACPFGPDDKNFLACRNPAGPSVMRSAGQMPAATMETTMKYMLLIYGSEDALKAAPAEGATKMLAAYYDYTEAMKKAGAWIGSNRLRPTAMATSVRVVDGQRKVLDGPYADTKEQLGGYYMIEAPDMDAALSWAARCPGASHGTIEVRPIWEMTA